MIDYSPLRALRAAALRHPDRLSMAWIRHLDPTAKPGPATTPPPNLDPGQTQTPATSTMRWSVAESLWRATELAAFLRRHHTRPEARLVVIGPNSPWHLTTFVAAAALPAVTVPLDQHLPASRLADVLRHCEPSFIFYDPALGAKVFAAAEAAHLATPAKLYDFEQLRLLTERPKTLTDSLETALRARAAFPDTALPICADSPGAIIYTSGTAERPKGTVLSWENLWWGCQNFRDAFEYGPDCIEGVSAPLSHIGGFNGTTTDLFSRGSTVVIFDRFHPATILEAIQTYRIEMMFAVPTMWRRLAELAEAGGYDTSSFTRCLVGGAAWEPGLAQRLIDLGWGPINIWGMTEQSASGACQSTAMLTGREDSVGLAFPYTQLRITALPIEDEAAAYAVGGVGARVEDLTAVRGKAGVRGGEVPAGEIGQIECRGPSVARQYFRDPKLTAATIDSPSGWLRTGDLGFIDSEGFLHLVGRISDTINTGGEKVFASRIAGALCAHPGISEVQVIGVPDPDWGQVVAAVAVAPDPQKAPTLEELREFCAAVLARHELPRRLHFVEQIPLNTNGKADRQALRALFETEA